MPVGGFVAVTVSTKESLAVRSPSLIVSVTVAKPVCPAAGVSVTVRFEPDPPRAMLLSGSRPGFDDEGVTARLAAEVSASPTVKLIGPSVVS